MVKALPFTSFTAALVAASLFTPPITLPAQAPQPGMGPVEAQEKLMWDDFKAGNYDGARALMAPDFLYSGPEGQASRDEAIAGMQGCRIASYTLGPAQYRMIGKDAVLLAYSATAESDCGPAAHAQHVSADMFVTTTWVKRDGKWLALSHTAAMKMGAPAQ